MSRDQDQRLVEAYERVVKGEDPKLDETDAKKDISDVVDFADIAISYLKVAQKTAKKGKEFNKAKVKHILSSLKSAKDKLEKLISGLEISSRFIKESKEFTKSKQKWMQNRAKDLKSAIDGLPGEINSGNANNIISTINGIESHLDVMKNSLKGVK